MYMPTIAITGASGYIGKELLRALAPFFNIIAIYRHTIPIIDELPSDTKIEWRQCDLFSISSIQQALIGADAAFYLVHSMLPSTRLFQGSFADTDLILADNFSRAAKLNQVKQILYLGGLIPNGQVLSKHLKSRHEVEGVLQSSDIPCTIFRASMVVGHGGSSFEILRNLVRNLPVMALPKWTKNTTQTIYIDDVMRSMKNAILNPHFFNQVINLVNGEPLNYEKLLRQTASGLKLHRLFFPFPFNFFNLSKRWVCLFGRADINLVSPLVDSLQVSLPQCTPAPIIEEFIHFKSFSMMLTHLQQSERKACSRVPHLPKLKQKKNEENNVRSVQRLPCCSHISCEQIAQAYFKFLPQFFRHLISVKIDENKLCRFYLKGLKTPLLELTHIEERSDHHRHLFYITNGILVRRKDYGWLEFRQIDQKKHTLAVIHEYIPGLPWYIYRFTQAPIHRWVMYHFGQYLRWYCKQNNTLFRKSCNLPKSVK